MKGWGCNYFLATCEPLLQVILYVFVYPPVTPFLNEAFVSMDNVFPLFGTFAFAVFCFYLIGALTPQWFLAPKQGHHRVTRNATLLKSAPVAQQMCHNNDQCVQETPICTSKILGATITAGAYITSFSSPLCSSATCRCLFKPDLLCCVQNFKLIHAVHDLRPPPICLSSEGTVLKGRPLGA